MRNLDVEAELTVGRGCLGADFFNIKLDLSPLADSLSLTDQSGCVSGMVQTDGNVDWVDATQTSFTKPVTFDYFANDLCEQSCDTDGIRIVIDPTTGLVDSVTATITTEGLSFRETVSLSGTGWPAECDSFTTGPQGTGGTAGSGGAPGSGGVTGSGGATGGAPISGRSCASGGRGRTLCASGESCCTSPLVPGGQYDPYAAGAPADLPHAFQAQFVDDFRLDAFEVTVGRFRSFVDAWVNGYRPAPGELGWVGVDLSAIATARDAWNDRLDCDSLFATWRPEAGANEERPMNCVNSNEARAFCAWDGGRLPTTVEWLYAAYGKNRERIYPWGTALPTPAHASYFENDADACLGDGLPGCTFHDLVAVGSKPLGNTPLGHADLAGNVAEWTDVAKQNQVFWQSGGSFDLNGTAFPALANLLAPQAASEKRFPGLGIRCVRQP